MRTIAVLFFFIYTVICELPSMMRLNSLVKKGELAERDRLTQKVVTHWAGGLVKTSGTRLKVTGLENIPQGQPVVIVSNHLSNFDIPILIHALQKALGFVAKVELIKIPFVSTWMKAMQCVFLERGNPRKALETMKIGAENIRRGYTMVIFPEGTRSKDGKIGHFKPGSLKLAVMAGVPILPVTLKGSDRIMRRGSLAIHPADVEVVIAPPIQASGGADEDTQKLTEQVKQVILQNYQ